MYKNTQTYKYTHTDIQTDTFVNPTARRLLLVNSDIAAASEGALDT